jgi:hypothetical protein
VANPIIEPSDDSTGSTSVELDNDIKPTSKKSP